MTRRKPTTVIEVKGDDLFGRKGSHNYDAEKAVISAILVDGRNVLDLLAAMLRGEHFYSPSHGLIFEVALELRERRVVVDIQTIANELKRTDRLHTLGDPDDDRSLGISYLVKIVDATPSVANVEAHARIVIEHWRVRTLQATCLQIAGEATADYGEPVAFVEHAEQRIYRIAHTDRAEKGARDLSDLIDREVTRQRRIESGEASEPGVSTGFPAIDEKTGGLRRGETWIIGGRPGMGKTALMLAIARAVGFTEITELDEHKRPKLKRLAAFVQSIEMTDEQLPRRFIASEARVSVLRATQGAKHMSPSELDAYYSGALALKPCRISIDDAAYVTPTTLKARVRRAVASCRAKGWDLFAVFVDYVQRMHADTTGDKGRSREREVAECMTACAELAKELGVCMIVGAQLNREIEGRSGKDMRPKLKDLRESGQLEQDAQQILLLHRPEYYVADKEKTPEEIKGFAEAVLAKVRDGEPGIIPIGFEAYCTRFHSWAGARPKPKARKPANADPDIPMFPENERYSDDTDTP